MSTPVTLTCTNVSTGESQRLNTYRPVPAYVLLGDPGAGKTTEFKREAEELGDSAAYVKARDFIADAIPCQELEGRILLIDGLDEMRAGAANTRTPLDEIRRRLVRLGRPNFRISCREADWLGPNDRRSLEVVSPDSTIRVLLLDPLSPYAIRKLLAEEIGDNAAAFMDEAELQGLGAMLRNPQTLKLLTKAVGPEGTWPDSRLETLELACRKLATEYNDEHRQAGANHPAEVVLDAAGHLCALLLLCGLEGYELASAGLAVDSGVNGLPPLDDVADTSLAPSRELLKAALATNLFRPEGETGRVPSHRLIAEFLAGRYLAKLIAEGLPARRVVALMTGPSDGRVVTALRGLSAWLAAHPGEARSQLIDADPVGIGLYGDIASFDTNDRERLLRSLTAFATQGPLFGHEWLDSRANEYGYSTGWAFRSLASADLVESIGRLLNSRDDGADHGRTAEFILDVLANAEAPEQESLAVLAPDLLRIVYEANRPSWVTSRALDAYIHLAPTNRGTEESLAGVLDDVQQGSIPDQHDDLRRTLLERLYPHVIRPADLWRYALPRSRQHSISSLGGFWDQIVLRESSDRQIAELLDAMCEGGQHLVSALAHSYLDDLPIQLLARGLRAFGDSLDMDRLFNWLDVAGNTHRVRRRNEDADRFVREWLESRPEVQKQVFLLWSRRQLTNEPARIHRFWACDALHKSKLPADFGLWCLNQAVMLENSEPELARGLLGQAYEALADPAIREGLTLAGMRDRVGTGVLARKLDELHSRHSAPADDDGWRQEMEARMSGQDEEEERHREERAQALRSQLDDLLNNQLFPPHLDTLAKVYLAMFSDVDEQASPRQRVFDFIGGDEVLVDAVMAAIRETVFRDDVPTVEDTISLHAESKHSWLAYPVLASLHLLSEEEPARLDAVSDDRKRKALAILYCVPSDGEEAHWHDRWFQLGPELVLDVLYMCAVPQMRAGAEFVPCLNALDRFGGREDPDPVLVFGDTGLFEARSPEPRFDGHDDLVHATRLRLLDNFPTRASNKQMGLLDDLLARVIHHPEETQLHALALGKLQRSSLNVGQRVRWMMVDALLSDGTNLKGLKEYVSVNEVRVQHLAEFLRRTARRDDMLRSVLAGAREPEVLRDAIEMLGRSFGPTEWGGRITLEMEMSELVARLIAPLGTVAGDDTSQAFRDLIANPLLERWRDRLTEARERHRVINRDASYRHPGIVEVQHTLGRGAPANAADLAALLQDRLADISADVQGGNDNPWRNYWNEDVHRSPTEPKHEDSCRDALLTDLKKRLPVEVDATPEGRYAADNRADIRASCIGFNVPVEIKKNSHPDLWTAIRRQLVGKYTTDPATSGYGIYLVLWFGAGETKTPPDGNRPDTPGALRQRLLQDLTSDEARKISVIVMDVTKPSEPPGGAEATVSPPPGL